MARRSTQKYTAQQKRDAIELANEIGTSLAAVRLGIPKGSLSCWRFRLAAVPSARLLSCVVAPTNGREQREQQKQATDKNPNSRPSHPIEMTTAVAAL